MKNNNPYKNRNEGKAHLAVVMILVFSSVIYSYMYTTMPIRCRSVAFPYFYLYILC